MMPPIPTPLPTTSPSTIDCVIMRRMKLPARKAYRLFYGLNLILITLIGLLFFNNSSRQTYAEEQASTSSQSHFVTIHDQGQNLTIKTDAPTVAEALIRAKIQLEQSDLVEPARTDSINADHFHINIYRSRPILILDGQSQKYLLSASYDPKLIAKAAGITLYDGDQIHLVPTNNLLETGIVSTYQITRQGGQTLTLETTIPFTEETKLDYQLPQGETKLLQVGEDGRKVTKYHINFVDGREVDRKFLSEEVVKPAVPRIVLKGAKKPLPPEWSTCADWVRAAGVAEQDLQVALTIIYRESGCRPSATNLSSGAYGIPQALPGSKMASAGADWQTNPVTQIRWMIGYVNGRYGGWHQAWAFWQANSWY